METGLIVTLISAVNLLLIGGILFLVWRKLGSGRENQLNDVAESTSGLQEVTGVSIVAGGSLAVTAESKDRNILAIEKLNCGVPADMVCREFGYSGSEIGILQAYAGLGRMRVGRT